jgi:hypothetical protein
MAVCVACTKPVAHPTFSNLKEEQQFALERVQLTHQQYPTALWEAQATRIEGDFNQARLFKVVLKRTPLKANTPQVHIKAAEGFADFERGDAWFTQPVLRTPHNKGEITSPKAVFSEQAQTIQLEGPLHYRSMGMLLDAEKGHVDLKEETVFLEGAVQGRLSF